MEKYNKSWLFFRARELFLDTLSDDPDKIKDRHIKKGNLLSKSGRMRKFRYSMLKFRCGGSLALVLLYQIPSGTGFYISQGCSLNWVFMDLKIL